jgi:hypothetical protein
MPGMRSFFATLEMARTDGVRARATMGGGRIKVSVPNPAGGSLIASFDETELEDAAEWLFACVIVLYPRCCLARLWDVIGAANAATRTAR